ncbi:MAG: hypothetical protein DRN66_01445 [Candidatus Nanohalarchaeota archaeon]|nr:MAG: hypothetical protein DRN66_01445 [Candidatus Nanohaloarchaeota archaeon]
MGFGEVFREDIGEEIGQNAYNFIFRDILRFNTDNVNLGGTLSGNQINDFSSSFGGNAFGGSSGNIDSWLYHMFFANNVPVLTGSLQHDFVFGLFVPTVFMLLFISFMTTDIFKAGPKLTKLTYLTCFIAAIVGGVYPIIAGIAFSFFGKLVGGFFIFLWIKNIYARIMAPYWTTMKTREEVGLTKAQKWNQWLSVLFGNTSILGGPAETVKDYAIAKDQLHNSQLKGEEVKKKKGTIVVDMPPREHGED